MLRAVRLEPIPFDIDRDLITPTFKLKRPQLLKHYKVCVFGFDCSIVSPRTGNATSDVCVSSSNMCRTALISCIVKLKVPNDRKYG